jgi:lipoyl-dependent peroxiredoxin
MAQQKGEATWEGSLKEGKGSIKLFKAGFEGPYTWASRFENGDGTNPEELLGASHASCFAMSMSSNLGKAGFTPSHIHTSALVTIERVEGQNRIIQIQLETEASVPDISEEKFQEIASFVKQNCPISVALSNVPITSTARLVSG